MDPELEDDSDLLDDAPVKGEENAPALVPSPSKPAQSDDTTAALRELASEMRAARETPKDEPDAPIDHEAAKRELAFWEPTETWIRKFFRANPEATMEDLKDQVDAMKEMQHGLMKQSYTGTMKMIAQSLQKFETERLAPLQEFYSRAQAKETRNAFNDSYPALADRKYDKILAAAQRELAGRPFRNNEEYFKAVAETAEEWIKGLDDSFSLSAVTKATKPTGTTPKLPRGRVGGNGGSGGGGGGGAADKGGKDEVFAELMSGFSEI